MRNVVYIILLCVGLIACSTGQTDSEIRSAADSIVEETVALVDSASRNDRGAAVAAEGASADVGNATPDSMMNLTPQQADSLRFRLSHHYSENFNFVVKVDSLTLIPREVDMILDTCKVYYDDVIVVASIKTVPGDSIDSVWVKVAHDQFTMGWIPERELLKGAIPDDSISEMLYVLTGSRGFWMSAMVFLGVIGFLLRRGKVKKLQILRFDEMDSFYPLLFLTAVAVMASLYASVQNFVPEYWQEYYYHPTLNPLQLPALMASLVVLLWLVIILYIAVVDEVYHNFYVVPGMAYLFELTGLGMVIYLVVSWTTLCYVGYVIAPVLVCAGWWMYIIYRPKSL